MNKKGTLASIHNKRSFAKKGDGFLLIGVFFHIYAPFFRAK